VGVQWCAIALQITGLMSMNYKACGGGGTTLPGQVRAEAPEAPRAAQGPLPFNLCPLSNKTFFLFGLSFDFLFLTQFMCLSCSQVYVLLLSSTFITSLASVFNEALLKGVPIPMTVQCFYLYAAGIVCNLIGFLLLPYIEPSQVRREKKTAAGPGNEPYCSLQSPLTHFG
jgi:hypothetical protein